jgi:hypothetical protein
VKRSLAQGAGYLVIDHRDSPGLSAEFAARAGAVSAPGGLVTERDVKQCAHCQRAVVLNPGRVRARGVCLKCDAYICDECVGVLAAGGGCVPFRQVLDVAAAVAARGGVDISVEALRQQVRPVTVAVGPVGGVE